jgi:hypothetical protein
MFNYSTIKRTKTFHIKQLNMIYCIGSIQFSENVKIQVMIFRKPWNKVPTGATSGAGTAYPPGEPELTPGF